MPHTASSTLLAHPDLALATACDVACADGARRGEARRWRPGLLPAEGAPLHSELFASGREASGAGAAVALARDWMDAATRVAPPEERVLESRAILWVQDRRSAALTGRPYRPGLPPGWRHRLIHVLADSAEDALFALEEGLRCRDLACVIGELAGNPRGLGFTQARRPEPGGGAAWRTLVAGAGRRGARPLLGADALADRPRRLAPRALEPAGARRPQLAGRAVPRPPPPRRASGCCARTRTGWRRCAIPVAGRGTGRTKTQTMSPSPPPDAGDRRAQAGGPARRGRCVSRRAGPIRHFRPPPIAASCRSGSPICRSTAGARRRAARAGRGRTVRRSR